MFKNDNYIKGFLIGLVINVVAVGIVWVLVEQLGVSLSNGNPQKLYILAAIPAILLLWYSIKKKQCVKMGMGVLVSVMILVGVFFLLIYK